MTWNYRIIAIPCPLKGWNSVHLTINDVYYDDYGNPCSYGEIGNGRWGEVPGGEDTGEIRRVLTNMGMALEKPILCGADRWPQIYIPQ